MSPIDDLDARHAPVLPPTDPARDGSPAPGSKLPYAKPRLRTIELVAEEVLSVGCKLATGPGGPIGATCTAAACFADGS